METIDMVGDMKDLMDMYRQMKANPIQFLSRRFNIPKNMDVNKPDDIVQYLLNTGQVTQNQVNQAMRMKQMFNK